MDMIITSMIISTMIISIMCMRILTIGMLLPRDQSCPIIRAPGFPDSR